MDGGVPQLQERIAAAAILGRSGGIIE